MLQTVYFNELTKKAAQSEPAQWLQGLRAFEQVVEGANVRQYVAGGAPLARASAAPGLPISPQERREGRRGADVDQAAGRCSCPL